MSSLGTTFTLTSSSSFSSPNPELFTPPPSHTSLQQVPDVFVIPPEEEHHDNPPFCYYDAAMESKQSLSIAPDIDALDVALGFYQQTEGNPAPVFHRSFSNESQETVIMPRRSESAAVSQSGSQRVLDDTDVVEVVKVRKSEGASNSPDPRGTYTLKKSKTFRARASQALRSIKNVGKSNRRAGIPGTWSVSSGCENVAESPAEDGMMSPRPSTPSLVRRKSMQLSQLFNGSRTRTPTPDVPLSPTSTSSSEWEPLGRPSLSIEDCTNSPYSASSPTTTGAPTLSKRAAFVRRISVLDLHKLFSPSTPTESKPPPLPRAKENIPPSASHASSKRNSLPPSSTTSSSMPSTDDIFGRASDSRPRMSHDSTTSYSLAAPSSAPQLDDVAEAADTSLEMHLDSFHFDSLHFDPDEFDPDEF